MELRLRNEAFHPLRTDINSLATTDNEEPKNGCWTLLLVPRAVCIRLSLGRGDMGSVCRRRPGIG